MPNIESWPPRDATLAWAGEGWRYRAPAAPASLVIDSINKSLGAWPGAGPGGAGAKFSPPLENGGGAGRDRDTPLW